ncbi:MAG: RNA polymerase sigma factor [Spirochaetes bacterium]|nr:RNA polymerase sigma factor [Spirochaetota bacterium]
MPEFYLLLILPFLFTLFNQRQRLEDEKDNQLVNIILSNEHQADLAFREIYRRYHKRIFKLIHNSVDNIDDCMDLFQQTFLNVYKSMNSFNPKYQFSTWIYRIATNVVLNYRRSQGRAFKFLQKYEKIQKPFFEPDFADQIYKDEMLNKLHQAIKKLPHAFSMPLLLTTIGELKTREVAGILKITQSAVRKRITRAKELLKDNLNI